MDFDHSDRYYGHWAVIILDEKLLSLIAESRLHLPAYDAMLRCKMIIGFCFGSIMLIGASKETFN
jgi:hypothetical protein